MRCAVVAGNREARRMCCAVIAEDNEAWFQPGVYLTGIKPVRQAAVLAKRRCSQRRQRAAAGGAVLLVRQPLLKARPVEAMVAGCEGPLRLAGHVH